MERIGNVLMIGDMHLGVKSFNEEEMENQLKMMEEVYKYCKEKGVKEIIQLGDIFDNRTVVNIKFLEEIGERLFKRLELEGLKMYVILGNHDIYYRERLEISLIEQMSRRYDSVEVIKEDKEMEINGKRVKMIPWITKERELREEDIRDVEYVIGHFEIRDFYMMKGIKDSKGIRRGLFKGKKVISGHYHMRQLEGEIKYLGTPYQMTWGDYKEEKGFYHWLRGDEIKFIRNEVTYRHVKIEYEKSRMKIKGLYEEDRVVDKDSMKEEMESLKGMKIKMYVREEIDEEMRRVIKEIDEKSMSLEVIDEREMTGIVGEVDNDMIKDPMKMIIEVVKEEREEALEILKDVLDEIL